MQTHAVSNKNAPAAATGRWRKIGHIYQPSGKLAWARSHGANPIAEHVDGDLFRIYFSARDDRNRSSIGCITIDLKNPNKILDEAQEPILGPGELGMHDDSGASIGCIVNVSQARYLYYMGWNLAVTVPWKNNIGLAISEGPGQPFKRHSTFPVLALNEQDPFTISYPWVTIENGIFRMWYGSNLKWGPVKEDMLHIIKYAESKDGINWERKDQIVINQESPAEYAICKPCVLRDERGYWMWFCSRGHRYRIQLAHSDDGITWTRLGRDNIDVSESGWDADMIEYPCVFEHKGERYLLYSGADYGRTGFGIAVLER